VGKEKIFWDVMHCYWVNVLDEQEMRGVLVSIDRGRLRGFLKDPLLKELGNYST
jgi:hypothetical protein